MQNIIDSLSRMLEKYCIIILLGMGSMSKKISSTIRGQGTIEQQELS